MLTCSASCGMLARARRGHVGVSMVFMAAQPFVLVASAPTVSSRLVHGTVFVGLTTGQDLHKRWCAVLGLTSRSLRQAGRTRGTLATRQ